MRLNSKQRAKHALRVRINSAAVQAAEFERETIVKGRLKAALIIDKVILAEAHGRGQYHKNRHRLKGSAGEREDSRGLWENGYLTTSAIGTPLRFLRPEVYRKAAFSERDIYADTAERNERNAVKSAGMREGIM